MDMTTLATWEERTMSVEVLERAVAEKPRVQSVKLEIDVVESARIVASCRRESITSLLSGLLRPIVHKLEREEMRKRLGGGKQ